ncbi:MAG: HIT family protein [Bilophila sp.]
MTGEQQETCLFCKIVRGEIPCAAVFESDDFVVFLDINPVSRGHSLVVPKVHWETLLDVSPDSGVSLVKTIQRVGSALMKATGAEGFNVVQNNFPAAGQEVAHVHWHIIPRFDGDGLKAWPQSGYADSQDMAELAGRIRAAC